MVLKYIKENDVTWLVWSPSKRFDECQAIFFKESNSLSLPLEHLRNILKIIF